MRYCWTIALIFYSQHALCMFQGLWPLIFTNCIAMPQSRGCRGAVQAWDFPHLVSGLQSQPEGQVLLVALQRLSVALILPSVGEVEGRAPAYKVDTRHRALLVGRERGQLLHAIMPTVPHCLPYS